MCRGAEKRCDVQNTGILKQALPYIRRYKNRIFVVKLGGELAQETAILDDIAQDVSLLYQIGVRIVMIHGGGPQATELSKKLGIAPRIVEGRRVTDEETLEVAKMVFAGKISDFIHRHPSLKMLALSFLLLVGFTLVAESFHREIPKGYIYFAMAFSLGVEVLNLKGRTRQPERPAVALVQPYR